MDYLIAHNDSLAAVGDHRGDGPTIVEPPSTMSSRVPLHPSSSRSTLHLDRLSAKEVVPAPPIEGMGLEHLRGVRAFEYSMNKTILL